MDPTPPPLLEVDAGRRPRSRGRTYLLWAALLSQGSPLGALALRFLVYGASPFDEIRTDAALYAYLSLATLAAFAVFGYVLGRFTDDLVQQDRALRQANHRLSWLAAVDPLTGVLNRRALVRRLRAELQRAQRENVSTALILLDLDHFKSVNDTYGHVIGDRVLRRLGRLLRRLARASDSVGRIGGEEFLIVLPATSQDEALALAERLRRTIARTPGTDIPAVTASLGVSARFGAAPVDVEGALREADAAMYRAKAEGRNRVCAAAEHQETAASTRTHGGSGSMS
jgi:diguanylate cyclase (GGDEF)-like protein